MIGHTVSSGGTIRDAVKVWGETMISPSSVTIECDFIKVDACATDSCEGRCAYPSGRPVSQRS